MIHLVVALGVEAAGLLEAFDLKRVETEEGAPPLFASPKARLVVSGVGRARAAAAAAALRARSERADAVWINVGVAAHRDLPLGATVVAHKVEEAATSEVWYPGLVAEPRLPTATVRTVDRAVAAPEDDAVYEMEASGFVASAVGWATCESVGVIKVISDHGVETPRSLDPTEVTRRIAAAADEVRAHAEAMHELLERRRPRWRGADLDHWLERSRFTVTERRRLARLANRAAALGIGREELDELCGADAGESMRRLEARLDAAALERR